MPDIEGIAPPSPKTDPIQLEQMAMGVLGQSSEPKLSQGRPLAEPEIFGPDSCGGGPAIRDELIVESQGVGTPEEEPTKMRFHCRKRPKQRPVWNVLNQIDQQLETSQQVETEENEPEQGGEERLRQK
ncbi:hypothetical protein ACJ72_01687 [Emergomyces africanus]|uniref:Uncharacterized protein n=1 Tax=Emergomyces africanus TaxID=1955775 RepID=A0A1B7P4I6_9EURO|nr:hypothetical protein ACJ72_01687 [Emergomyces africanus]